METHQGGGGLAPTPFPSDIQGDIKWGAMSAWRWLAAIAFLIAAVVVAGVVPGGLLGRGVCGAVVFVLGLGLTVLNWPLRLRRWWRYRRRPHQRRADATAEVTAASQSTVQDAIKVRAQHGSYTQYLDGSWAVVLRLEPPNTEMMTDSRLLALQRDWAEALERAAIHHVELTVYQDLEPDLCRDAFADLQTRVEALPLHSGLRRLGEARLAHFQRLARAGARRVVYHLRIRCEGDAALRQSRTRYNSVLGSLWLALRMSWLQLFGGARAALGLQAEAMEAVQTTLHQAVSAIADSLQRARVDVMVLGAEPLRDTVTRQLDVATWLMVEPPAGAIWGFPLGEDLPLLEPGRAVLVGLGADAKPAHIPPPMPPAAPAPRQQTPHLDSLPEPEPHVDQPAAATPSVTPPPAPIHAPASAPAPAPTMGGEPGPDDVDTGSHERLGRVVGLLKNGAQALGEALRRRGGATVALVPGAKVLHREIVAVLGPCGGQGVTSVAANLAMVCRRTGHDACLVTLDGKNHGARALGVHMAVSPFDWADDAEAVIVPGPRGLWVVPGPTTPGSTLEEPVITRMFGLLGRQCDVVVADLGHAWTPEARAVVTQASAVLIVVTGDLNAWEELPLTLERLRAVRFDVARAGVLLNRHRDGQPIPSGVRPTLILPEDGALTRAQYRGTVPALTDDDSSFVQALARWVQRS